MNFIKMFVLSMAVVIVVGVSNRVNQAYTCYTYVMEDAERSKNWKIWTFRCIEDVHINGRFPCYYKGCK